MFRLHRGFSEYTCSHHWQCQLEKDRKIYNGIASQRILTFVRKSAITFSPVFFQPQVSEQSGESSVEFGVVVAGDVVSCKEEAEDQQVAAEFDNHRYIGMQASELLQHCD